MSLFNFLLTLSYNATNLTSSYEISSITVSSVFIHNINAVKIQSLNENL